MDSPSDRELLHLIRGAFSPSSRKAMRHFKSYIASSNQRMKAPRSSALSSEEEDQAAHRDVIDRRFDQVDPKTHRFH